MLDIRAIIEGLRSHGSVTVDGDFNLPYSISARLVGSCDLSTYTNHDKAGFLRRQRDSMTVKLSSDQVRAVVDGYIAGQSTVQLGAIFGVSSTAIAGLLRRRNVARRHPQQQPITFHEGKSGKVCTKCHTWRTLDQYTTDRTRAGGLFPHCRCCHYGYKHANRDWLNKNQRDRYALDLDKHREYHRKWRTRNLMKAKAASRRDRVNHSLGYRIRQNNRRVRLSQNGGRFTVKEWQCLCAAYGFRCLCCGQVKPLTADHVIPIVHGGSGNIANIQPLCASCNSKKGIKHTDYRGLYRPSLLEAT
jgi:5-methylcytosine-specific restriction endonuclease McrA